MLVYDVNVDGVNVDGVNVDGANVYCAVDSERCRGRMFWVLR